MTFIIATCAAVVTAFVVDWGQRQCEIWALTRDKDL
jgi:hypothetical protein